LGEPESIRQSTCEDPDPAIGPRQEQGPAIEVSTIIATRDRWSALASSLRTALAQTGVTSNVFVVDDASATRPPPDVGQLLRDDRVVLVRLPEPRGAVAAANLGVRDARGDWLAVLNDRDLWAPYHLATLVEACSRDAADYGYSAAWLVDAQRRIRGFRPAPPPDALARTLLEENVIASSTVIARREFWERAGGYDEWLTVLADWDLGIRWSRLGRACMVSVATVASAAQAGGHGDAVAARELRELKRRYGRDAKRAGVRFGSGVKQPAGNAEGDAPLDVRPPWLVEESPTETV
jgi:glycosyltransferase involved in cell wall biosynthesis